MDASKAREFREGIVKKYSFFYRSYPGAFLILDFLVQLKRGREMMPKTYSERDIQAYFNLILKTDLLTSLYCGYLHFGSFFLKRYKKKFTIHVSIDDKKFPGLIDVIENISEENHWCLIKQGEGPKRLLPAIYFRTISPYRYFLSSKTKKLFARFRGLDENSWWALLGDVTFMKKLDLSTLKDVQRTSDFLERTGINLFLNTGDSSGPARILVEASKLANAMTLSFAHGYVNDSRLLGIAPIQSDRLIVWTEQQGIDISRGLDSNQGQKIAYVGFPKKYLKNNFESGESSALLLLGVIENVIADDYLKEQLETVIVTLKEVSSRVRIRLHPHERRGIPSIEALIAYWGLEYSILDLAEEISSADIIAGANTSTLLEAASSGKVVYEIDELVPETNKSEGTCLVSAGELKRKIQGSATASNSKQFSFDKEKIAKKMTKLIYDLGVERDIKIQSRNNA